MSKKRQSASSIAIKPEPNIFHDNFLEVVGNAFKFDHPKGIAEWMKNSADAYSTSSVRDDQQFILLRFNLVQPKSQSVFECIDFVGCTKKDINDAMKIWGSPDAAKKGTEVATFGGHGNGGKFYMRQMFHTSQMVTYKNGLANVFGFDETHRYGFSPKYSDREMTLAQALQLAEIDDLDIPDCVKDRWKRNPKRAGFSVVRGMRPSRFSGRSTLENVLEGIRYHPQARRILRHKQVIVVKHGQSWGEKLNVPIIAPKPGFETPREIPLPKFLESDGESISTKGSNGKSATLVLRTSELPLTRSSELSSLNTIDIIGEVGCIGSYRMNEIGFMRNAPESEFIYGECECAFLENKKTNCVSNDREKLVSNELTSKVLGWILQQVDQLASEISNKRRDEKKSRDLAQSSLFNQMLDKWKNRFMARISAELFGGSGLGDTFGGTGGGGSGGSSGSNSGSPIAGEPLGSGTSPAGGSDEGGPSTGDPPIFGGANLSDGDATGNQAGDTTGSSGSAGDGANSGTGKGIAGGKGERTRPTSKFPKVLLSGQDVDPLDPQGTQKVECDPRHPPVYQRPVIDVENGIYWINTRRSLADKILAKYGANGPRWRDYLFQRYVDIILKQQFHNLERHNSEFKADDVDALLDKVTAMVHDAAAEDLEQFLFEENLTGSAPNPAEQSGERVGGK